MKKVRRGPVLLLLAAILIAGGLIDREAARSSSSEGTVTTLPQVPAAAPASARSSAWYCTGVNAAPNSLADGSVMVANAGDRSLTGTVTVIPSQGAPQPKALELAPASRQVVKLSQVAQAPFASAVVELDGGEAVTQLTTTGPLGDSVAQCSSAASDRWYFADGVTTKDAFETLLLFNPFPDDAVVDLTFTTEEGQVRPESLTGLSVPGRATAAISVNEFVQRRETVSTAVAARTGRLVVARQQAFDGTAGRRGISVTLGAAAPAGVWYFPEGRVSDGLVERYQLFNPSGTETRAELAFHLEQGTAEPMLLTIPAHSRVTVTANDEARVPKDVSHAVTVRTLNDGELVVERTVDGRQSGRRSGVAMTIGARTTARRWSMAAGQADDTVEEWLVFQNPGRDPASVSVVLLAGGQRQPIDGLQNVEVAPGGRRGVRINDTLKRDALPVVVEANRPIVVEQDLYRTRGTGIAMTMGLQLRD